MPFGSGRPRSRDWAVRPVWPTGNSGLFGIPGSVSRSPTEIQRTRLKLAWPETSTRRTCCAPAPQVLVARFRNQISYPSPKFVFPFRLPFSWRNGEYSVDIVENRSCRKPVFLLISRQLNRLCPVLGAKRSQVQILYSRLKPYLNGLFAYDCT